MKNLPLDTHLLSEKLEGILSDLGWSQARLAKEARVNPGTLSDWKNGSKSFTQKNVGRRIFLAISLVFLKNGVTNEAVDELGASARNARPYHYDKVDPKEAKRLQKRVSKLERMYRPFDRAQLDQLDWKNRALEAEVLGLLERNTQSRGKVLTRKASNHLPVLATALI